MAHSLLPYSYLSHTLPYVSRQSLLYILCQRWWRTSLHLHWLLTYLLAPKSPLTCKPLLPQEGTYELKLLPHMKVHPVFNISLLTKAEKDLIPGWTASEPAPIIVEGHQEYEIEKIIASNWFNKHFQYKVKYKGYVIKRGMNHRELLIGGTGNGLD